MIVVIEILPVGTTGDCFRPKPHSSLQRKVEEHPRGLGREWREGSVTTKKGLTPFSGMSPPSNGELEFHRWANIELKSVALILW
jgi:hypothetical protein